VFDFPTIMDPLSIAASTATLVHVLRKSLNAIQAIRDAPQEIRETSLQISSILAVLQKLSRLTGDSFVRHIVDADLGRASETALSLYLLVREIFEEGGKFNYTTWMRKKSKLGQLRTKLKDAVGVLGLALELFTT
jgi:hypothetical protein